MCFVWTWCGTGTSQTLKASLQEQNEEKDAVVWWQQRQYQETGSG